VNFFGDFICVSNGERISEDRLALDKVTAEIKLARFTAHGVYCVSAADQLMLTIMNSANATLMILTLIVTTSQLTDVSADQQCKLANELIVLLTTGASSRRNRQ